MARRKRTRVSIADVRIGAHYAVKVAGRICSVQIKHRASIGVWQGVNTRTGRAVYVALRDLICQTPARPPSIDRRRIAAGDLD
jgi:hypothetical protein